MKDRSFRDILHQFLEEKTEEKAESARHEPSFSVENASFFEWKAPEFRHNPRHGYATSPRKKEPVAAAKPAAQAPKPAPPEPMWKMSELKPADQAHALRLIQLGATELAQGISLTRVKKAHRRLAKQLHPDRGGKREQFQLLQSAYEALSKSLSSYIISQKEAA